MVWSQGLMRRGQNPSVTTRRCAAPPPHPPGGGQGGDCPHRAKAASDRVASGSPQQGSKCQTACKPGSVPPESGDDHSSGPPVAGRFSRPTRTPRAVNPATEVARRPYSVLLQAGLAMPSLLPATRWALTPPFHPYPRRNAGGLLSVALSLGSPRAGITRRLFTVEPGLSSTGASPAATARPSGGGSVRAQAAKVNAGRQFSTPVTLSAVASCSTPISVARVSPSAMPSTFDGRQWRWKASTMMRVSSVYLPSGRGS